MKNAWIKRINRRNMLKRGAVGIAGAMVAGSPARLLADALTVLDVASAGSIRAMLDGPMKAAALHVLGVDLHSHAQGADAVAHALVDGILRADVFIPITAGPMQTVMTAGKVDAAYPIARTEMVLVYSPKSRFAARFAAAAAGREDWWEILQAPGLRFARGNPAGDPGGRNAFFVLMLAAKKYGHPELVERLLGSVMDSPAAGNNQEKMQTGDLDVTASYRVAASFGSMPFVTLPGDLNLSGDRVAAEHPDVSLSMGGKTYRPEPLVFYAGVLKDAVNPKAAAFVDWMLGAEGQALLQKYRYDAPGAAAVLRA